MSLSEAPAAPRCSGSQGARSIRLHGWGGGPGVRADVVAPREERELAELLAETQRPVICRGMGRSYGDAAQRDGGVVLDLRAWRWWSLDEARGTVRAGAGATLGQLLGSLAPIGWLLPVVPGTQHVSVGGAIASDIHGKNHGTAGTFGAHVRALGLLTADGESRELSREGDDELFQATIGGMGLTGVITWAEIELQRVPPEAELSVDSDRVGDLDAILAALDSPEGGPHRVAWLDLLGRPLVRGVVTRAEVAAPEARTPHRRRRGQAPTGSTATVAAKARIPAWWPGGALRPETVRAFNAQRFQLSPRCARGHRERFGAHMFPLDALEAWPRLYGQAGFLQYQCVLPRGREVELQTVLERLRGSSTPCYLAVLKDFGPENFAPLSFPLAGWTLALDLPRTSGLLPLLAELDGIVAGSGGRVYLAKDARLAPDTLEAMYPRLPRWRAARDRVDPEGRWQSDLARRTGLVSS